MPFIRGIASSLGAQVPLSALQQEGVPRVELVQLAARGALHFHRATQSVLELAVSAGRESLLRAQVHPAEIGVLLFGTNSARSPELEGDVAHQLLARLELTNAHVQGIWAQNCGDGVLALKMGSALVRAGETAQVLVIIADKICDAGVPRILKHAYLHSDGASACVISARGPGFRIGPSAVRHALGAPGQNLDPYEIDLHLQRFLAEALRWMNEQAGPIAAGDVVVTHNINRVFNHQLSQALGVRPDNVLGTFTQGHCLGSDVLMNLERLEPGSRARVWMFAPTHRSFAVMQLATEP